MFDSIKWLIASFSIISMENMEKKIEESQNKDFTYYNLQSPSVVPFNLQFINHLSNRFFKIYQIVYSYEENKFYSVKSCFKDSLIFAVKMQDLEQTKPLNSKFKSKLIDDSQHGIFKCLMLDILILLQTFTIVILYTAFLPISISVNIVKYLFF